MLKHRYAGVAVAFTLASVLAAAQDHEHNRDEIVKRLAAALGVKDGAAIADVGAGDGDYSVPLARSVGASGRIFAVDVNPVAVERLRTRIARDGLTNVEVVQGDLDDPKLAPGSLDGVLIMNAYHEMTQHEAMLRHIRAALKPAGRLVIDDTASLSRRTQPRDEQTRAHEIAPELVQRDLRAAGFAITSLEDPFTAHPNAARSGRWMIVATPGEAPAPTVASGATAVEPTLDTSSPGLRIAFDEFLRLYRAGQVIVLDVRDAASFGRGRIPKARLAPMSAMRDVVADVRTTPKRIVAYCECPAEETSARATIYLRQRGITGVHALTGGWARWVASGNPVEK